MIKRKGFCGRCGDDGAEYFNNKVCRSCISELAEYLATEEDIEAFTGINLEMFSDEDEE